MPELKIETCSDSVVFTAKIVPGSSRTSIEGVLDDMLKIKIAAPPEKGKANKELISFLAKKLNIKKNDIQVISGQTNPVKQLSVKGVAAEIIRRLVV